MVDPTEDIERERQAELERLAKQFGAPNKAAMAEFPKIQFKGMRIILGVYKTNVSCIV